MRGLYYCISDSFLKVISVAMPSGRGPFLQRWTFTLNNWTEEEKAILEEAGAKEDSMIQYLVFGKEHAPTTGTEHLQGYVEFAVRKRMAGIKKILGQRVHLSPAHANADSILEYCGKEDQEPFIFGTPIRSSNGTTNADGHSTDSGSNSKGQKGPVSVNYLQMREDSQLLSEDLMLRKYNGTWLKARESIKRSIQETQNADMREAFLQRFDSAKINLRTWQKALIKSMEEDLQLQVEQPDGPSSRRIYFVVDEEGNAGKSFLVKYILANYQNSICMASTAMKDVSYIFGNQEIVLFDICRSSENFINYGTLEKLKDGCLFNTKYHSSVKLFESPIVIVFSNHLPDYTKLSMDRYITFVLRCDEIAGWHLKVAIGRTVE
jgi:hypothetical protein